MNPNENTEPTATEFVALRAQPEALKLITERLKVKEMGAADHIRTKHEVRAWLETKGSELEAATIIDRAQARRRLRETQNVTQKMSERQQRGETMEQ